MADIVNFRRLKHAAPGQLPSLARAATRQRARQRWFTFWLMVLGFVASASVVAVLLGAVPVRLSALLPDAGRAPASSPAVAVHFPVCAGPVRGTCVVDGDTFWLEGIKYRIADIDTPEISQPQCVAEKALGERAKLRLAELLSAGAFTLAAADRDEDRYGRKLRLVVRDGASVGALLVGEGLAHRWDGGKHGWC
ncbi:thermonuclease family protein [Devosia sp. ZB163]|uniref:thermonuclease family protein n=1 Tax=Devosia sp. ZB163 TaxID=3025938 RepID=UPI0030811E90